MWFPLLLLSLAASCVIVCGDQDNCEDRIHLLPTNIRYQEYVVRFSKSECGKYTEDPLFCEDSGWGDEEANVVCKSEKKTTYGLGGYILTSSDNREAGISYVHCNGNEEKLGDCEFGNLTSHKCSFLGAALCLNVPQVLFSNNGRYNPLYIELSSENETAGFCIDEWGPLSQPLHVLVETIDSNTAANFDYRPLRQTVTFEATENLRSQQCLEIEIIDDSLAEPWENFIVEISTNNTHVNLTRREFSVYIAPNAGSCTEGNVTVSTDADGSSLQLVEMYSNGVWSPLCDNDWTLQDVTVVCRELGYADTTTSVRYETINKNKTIPSIISCGGNETALRDCIFTESPVNTVCQLLLVDCQPVMEPETVDPGVKTKNNTKTIPDHDNDANENQDKDRENETKAEESQDSSVGVVDGILVAVLSLVVIMVVVVSIIAVLKCKLGVRAKISTTHNPAYGVVQRIGARTTQVRSTPVERSVSKGTEFQSVPNPSYNLLAIRQQAPE